MNPSQLECSQRVFQIYYFSHLVIKYLS
jgi:hypothetical protein